MALAEAGSRLDKGKERKTAFAFRLPPKLDLTVERRDGVECVEVTGRSATPLPVEPIRDPALQELASQWA